MRMLALFSAFGAATFLLPVAAQANLPAPTCEILPGATTGGSTPIAGLIYDGSTFLYGTTVNGGVSDHGTIFRINKNCVAGSYKVIYSFDGGANGSHPSAALIKVGAQYYGTTSDGASGNGTIFRLDPIIPFPYFTLTTIHTFAGGASDGANPAGKLTYVPLETYQNGQIPAAIYGTTKSGGANGLGTLFIFAPPGAGFTLLHSFAGASDGQNPNAGLTEFSSATQHYLFGTTVYGGPQGKGTLFSWEYGFNIFGLHHTFMGGAGDGANPYGDLLYYNYNMYGTTLNGGQHNLGTVFKMDTVSYFAEAPIYHFLGGTGSTADGANPTAGVMLYANASGGPASLFGATTLGGAYNRGAIYKIPIAGAATDTICHDFTGAANGAYPPSTLLNVVGIAYGTTSSGGDTTNDGKLFKFNIPTC